jgi:hypothetical protein
MTILREYLSIEAIDQIIARLIYLNSVIPNPSPRTLLPKFSLPKKSSDLVISLQKAARTIATYLDLSDLTFLVTLQSQEKNIAGRIHLNTNSSLVEIELSPDILSFEDAIIATVCHEVVHRFLFRHGINNRNKLENEKLTDTAAAYLGLGHLMIEGCACERTDYTARGRSITKLRTGYLTSEEFGLTYAFVALARESRGLDVFKKLSSDAERRVDFAKVSFLEAFPKETEKKRLPQLAVLETLSARIRTLQARDLSLAHLLDRRGTDAQAIIRVARRPVHRQLHEFQKLLR